MTLPGYWGRVALVDLSTRSVRVEELPEDAARLFIGGKGLLYYYGFRLIAPSCDPLNPSCNRLVVAPGLLSGLAPSSSKAGFLAKSPLTGILCDTYAGQVFAAKLKKAGFDAVVLGGRCSTPCYVYIEDGRVEVRDARHLWGSLVGDTVEAVRRETRLGASVAAIGPAGERLVRYACIVVDGFRAAGRCGLGAVMGAMRVKALAVWGSMSPPLHDPERVRALYLEAYKALQGSPAAQYNSRRGTLDGVRACSSKSMCPGWHWQRPWLPWRGVAERLSGDEVLSREDRAAYRGAAGYIWGWGCPVKCSKLVRPARRGLEHILVKPEYEHLAMLGLCLGVLDVDDVLVLAWTANQLGVDVISAGEAIGWFMELCSRGLIEEGEFGVTAGFGDAAAARRLLEMIAYRRGVGAVLAEGVERAARILGRGLEAAVHVKGLESAGWDPRGRRGLALSYATADVGASHLRGWPSVPGSPSSGPAAEAVESLIRDRDWKALMDSLGLCVFSPYPRRLVEEFYSAVTGVRASADELAVVGWRCEALARIHAALSGRVPEGDAVPPRWMEPVPEGPLQGERAFRDLSDFREALEAYYRARGYDAELGIPLPETLRRLGLDWCTAAAEEALREAGRRRACM